MPNVGIVEPKLGFTASARAYSSCWMEKVSQPGAGCSQHLAPEHLQEAKNLNPLALKKAA